MHLPSHWNAKEAGDRVLETLVRITPAKAKGAHDAEFACVGDYAYIVEHDNDVAPGHWEGEHQYCILSILHLPTLRVEKQINLAHSEEKIGGIQLPKGACFVPRILQKDARTLRCFFATHPHGAEAQMWYRDFDLERGVFEDHLEKAKLKTSEGLFDFQPKAFHRDAIRAGFSKPGTLHGFYIFDSFKSFDGTRFVALNNFDAKQNALAILHDDFATFEVIGHYNEPQTEALSESSVNRLPDGQWLAICRNEKGNYHFARSRDGRLWAEATELEHVRNGENSKPTFDRFGDTYYLGWQENTHIGKCYRSVFNIDISTDGVHWQRKYRFESSHSFQYPTFHAHNGAIWFTVTQSDHGGSSDRIMFGKLENL